MSNPSLKEQLQSLVPTPASTTSANPLANKEARHKKFAPRKPDLKKPQSSKPAWLEYVFYGVELLKAHYPLCFKEASEIKPLKIGIKQDLVIHLSSREDIVIADKTCMIKSLSYYVTTLNYFKNVSEGVSRIDLQGKPAGVVTSEEAQYSADQYQAKLQKKSARRPKTNE